MKEKGAISRKQFLTGGASVVFGAIMGKLSGDVYAEEESQNVNPTVNSFEFEKEWEQLPLDVLSGAYLVSDPDSPLFGGTLENAECFLSQYIHVYPGLEIVLSKTSESSAENGWVGYNKECRPVAIMRSKGKNSETGKRAIVTVPAGVYYLRGSCSGKEGTPNAWVRNIALYALNCGLNKPDVFSYTEITELGFDQHSRDNQNGKFDMDTGDYPSVGDEFFTPIGTDIILTFNNANIAPYIFSGENYTEMDRGNILDRHYGFGYSWYHCKTTEICNYFGACYETYKGCAKTLTLDELWAAEPHLYIRFPSRVTHTMNAALIRTKGVKSVYKRLFTVLHVTDTHGDADATHAAYEYADQIGANFVALTGDYVPYGPYHGYNILHSIINNAKTPTMITVGNHDVVGLSDQAVNSTCLGPIKDTIQAFENQAYYYRDFQYDGQTVRAICLCPFEKKASSHVNAYYSQEQLLWMCDAMATVPDGGHIFILRHYAHHKPVCADEGLSMFYDYADSSTDVGNLWLSMGADPVVDIVDAYNERKPIYAQYTGMLKNATEIVTVEYDFSNRPNSEFVAYFVGHVHCDAVGYARNTKTKQAVLCSLCTTGVKGTEESHSYAGLSTPRDYGTDSQIALNVFTFDFMKKSIYVARVGNEIFNDREKTWMELPYGI